MKSQETQTFSAANASTFPGKLVRYSAGVGALAAVVALPARSAQADVVSFDGAGFTGDPIYLNIMTAGSASAATFNGAEFELYTTSGPASPAKPTVKGLNGAQVDTSSQGDGSTISGADSFSNSFGVINSTSPEDFYIGLRVPAQAGSTTDYFYGYVHFTDTDTAPSGQALTLDNYAYNNTVNAPITIPEPSSLALLVAGAVGVGVLAARRRKASGVTAGQQG